MRENVERMKEGIRVNELEISNLKYRSQAERRKKRDEMIGGETEYNIGSIRK